MSRHYIGREVPVPTMKNQQAQKRVRLQKDDRRCSRLNKESNLKSGASNKEGSSPQNYQTIDLEELYKTSNNNDHNNTESENNNGIDNFYSNIFSQKSSKAHSYELSTSFQQKQQSTQFSGMMMIQEKQNSNNQINSQTDKNDQSKEEGDHQKSSNTLKSPPSSIKKSVITSLSANNSNSQPKFYQNRQINIQSSLEENTKIEDNKAFQYQTQEENKDPSHHLSSETIMKKKETHINNSTQEILSSKNDANQNKGKQDKKKKKIHQSKEDNLLNLQYNSGKRAKSQDNFVRQDLRRKYKDRFRGNINSFKKNYKANGNLKAKKYQNYERAEDLEMINEGENNQNTSLEGTQTYVKGFKSLLKGKKAESKEIKEPRLLQHPLQSCPYISQGLKDALNEDSIEDLIFEKKELENDQDFLDFLNHQFKYEQFRAGQLEAIKKIYQDLSCLVILSTGCGKSLIYQYASLIKEGITIVISPLISLINDQLNRLPRCLTGACFNSSLKPEHKKMILPLIKDKKVKILFMSPEYLQRATFEDFPNINLVCIDEAHCISEWSHNFRTSYFSLGNLIRQKFGKNVPILGLTATATQKTQESIIRNLDLSQEQIIKGQSVIRDNLKISICRDNDPYRSILQLLKSPLYKKLNSIIIYCHLKRTVESLTTHLNTNGITAVAYHGEKSDSQRLQIQSDFMTNKCRVIVATNAFGMGIDKADVRSVIHVNLPKSFESYIQEIGRAGRDGKLSYCHTFLTDEDYFKFRGQMFSEVIEINHLRSIIRKLVNAANNTNKLQEEVKKRKFSDLKDCVEEEKNDAKINDDDNILKEKNKEQDEPSTELYSIKASEMINRSTQKIETLTTIIMSLKSHPSNFFKLVSCGKVNIKLAFYKNSPELESKGEFSYELEDEGYFYQLRNNITYDEQVQIVNSIYSQIKQFELNTVYKLDFTYSVLRLYSRPSVESMIRRGELEEVKTERVILDDQNSEFELLIENGSQSTIMKPQKQLQESQISFMIDSYFNKQINENSIITYREIISSIQDLDDILPIIRLSDEDKSTVHEHVFQFLNSQNEGFLSKFEAENQFQSIGFNRITKIFQGIHSEETPINEWKYNPFWGKYMQNDYEEVSECVKKSIISYLIQQQQNQNNSKISQEPEQQIEESQQSTNIIKE